MRIGHECPVYQVKTDFDEAVKIRCSQGLRKSLLCPKLVIMRLWLEKDSEACAIFYIAS